ncbi:MAG: methyl-accepting chemotaxis protein [Methylovulum sp.]|nr:methyl-accepting chemotaxis protein [Methylovulum sp.]
MLNIHLTVRQLLLSMTLLVLTALLLLSFVGLRNIQKLNEGMLFIANTGQAVRMQMDADMMHDAIRADVLGVILASRDGQPDKMQDIQKELGEHITRFNRNIADNAQAKLGQPVSQQIEKVIPLVNAYNKQAEAVIATAIQGGKIETGTMDAFGHAFDVLEADMEKLADLIQHEADAALEVSHGRVDTSRINSLSILAGAIGVFILLAWYLFRRIAHPLAALVKNTQEIHDTGNFGIRAEIESQDELGQLDTSFNSMMDFLQIVLDDTNAVMGAVAKGDFTARVTAEAHGDLQRLKANVNASIDKLEFTMAALTHVMKALHAGDFTKRVDDKVEGDIKQTVDDAMSSMQMMLGDIGQVMGHVAQGDISQRVTSEGRGDFAQLKNNINQSLDALDCLNDIVRVANALSEGDLTQAISKHYPGTFGAVITNMNLTGENLKSLVGEIKNATDTITGAAKEIASGNNDLSHRTEEQAASLEETAASMEQLTSTVQANSENAKQANQLARSAAEIADKGVAVVGKVVTTMASINASSTKIVDIISVIDSIAFQTNILALNAAVEAARAGEQGRGFAVVAGEVRNLAQRAAAAAGEIKCLINDSVEQVEDGSKLVVQAGQTMEEIVGSIRRVTVIMNAITAASIEQTSGIQQVNQAIGQMDDVTQQNAALVEQAAAAAESLEDQAQGLLATVDQFKVDDHPTPARAPIAITKPKVAPVKIETYKGPSKTPGVRPALLVADADEWEEF